MKKLFFHMSILAGLILPQACVQDIVAPDEVTVSFDATIQDSGDDASRTVLGEKGTNTEGYYPNYWAEGDAISVNGIKSAALAGNSQYVGTKSARFQVSGSLSAPYRCAYPASAVSSYSSGSATVTLPDTQELSTASYDASAFIMLGNGSSSTLTFSPKVSLIRLTVPGPYDAKISYVMFESLGGMKVSGRFTTDFSDLSATGSTTPRVCGYAPGEGIEFGNGVYLVIPAQTYTGGMKFTVRATDGTQMVFQTSSELTAKPGRVYKLTTKRYTPQAETIPDGLMVMSSNVRFASARDKSSNPDTGDRDWNNRKSAYYAMANYYRPAVLCLQEAEREQVQDIKDNCSGYSYYGLGNKLGEDILKSDGLWNLWGNKHNGESCTILYRTDLITMGSHGTIWHSNSPSSAGSYFPGMTDGTPQTSSWAILTYKPTNTQFFLMNVHLSIFDTKPQEISLILNTINSKNTGNLPVIICGDWNLEDGDSWLNPVESVYYNARHRAQETDDYGTYHWWGTQSRKIDHVYYKGIGDCYLYRTVAKKWNDKYISDHYPIFAVFNVSSSTTTVPFADFNVPDGLQIDKAVTFTDRSSAPAGIAYWEWDFDGIRSNEQNPTVTFRSVRSDVPVRLTIVDNNGQKATATKFISVESSDDHKLTQVWRRVYDSTEGATAYWTSPAVNADGNRIYVCSSGYHLVGYNASGSQFGSYDVGKYGAYISGEMNCQTPTPSIDIDGNVYIPEQYSTGGSGSGGLFCLKGDLSAERWYVNTGTISQYRCCIPAIFGSYVSILLTNVDTDLFSSNMLILNRTDGSLKQTLTCDKGSFGGMAVSEDGTLVFGAARGGSNGGKSTGEETGAGFKVGVLDGGFGSWKTSGNSDTGRSYNFLGLTHTDGYGYRTKGFQPAISTIDGSVYVAVTTDDNNMVCARYNLNSYVYNSVPTPIWKVEVAADASNYGLGCALDDEGNAYYRAADKVFKLNGADGSLLWEVSTSNNAGNCGVPAIDNLGYVYVTDRSKQLLLKLSPQDGSVVSQTQLSITPRTSPTIDSAGNIYVCGTSVEGEGAVLYKITCPKTTGHGANWSQLGGNPQKTCRVPGSVQPYGGTASHEQYNSITLF
jgi:endonuclease/exonuclease/phosphatase family metal-dependent hydrolase